MNGKESVNTTDFEQNLNGQALLHTFPLKIL